MNKFKVFFTFIAFFWLLLCGFAAIYAIASGDGSNSPLAWCGLLINAWALPIWMLVRYLNPQKLSGDLRESGAFFGVLIGLAISLLTDSERGLPVYLAICNLFVVLVYLYHLSAVGHPEMPALDEVFPPLEILGGENWQARALRRNRGLKSLGDGVEEDCQEGRREKGIEKGLSGVLVIFLRGSYCADSRRQVCELRELIPELTRRNVGVVLLSAQPASKWPAFLVDGFQVLQLDVTGMSSARFVAPSAAPIILRPWLRDAARPSAWLLDGEGYVLWRELAVNYRVLAGVELLRSQLFRVEE